MLGHRVTGKDPRQCYLDQAGKFCSFEGICKALLAWNPTALEDASQCLGPWPSCVVTRVCHSRGPGYYDEPLVVSGSHLLVIMS